MDDKAVGLKSLSRRSLFSGFGVGVQLLLEVRLGSISPKPQTVKPQVLMIPVWGLRLNPHKPKSQNPEFWCLGFWALRLEGFRRSGFPRLRGVARTVYGTGASSSGV